MSDNWQKTYSNLQEFISSHPQIRITPSVVAIPADVRPEFYRLFDEVRLEFMKEKMPTIFKEAQDLAANINQEIRETVSNLGLDGIDTATPLCWLLADPPRGLNRALFEPLFALIKGKINLDTFTFEAAEEVGGFSGPLFKTGYEKWVLLSLLNMSIPDQPLSLPARELQERCIELQDDEKRGFFEEEIPDPGTISQLFLGHEGHDPSLILASIIVHSKKLGRYMSVGADLDDASWGVKNATQEREWIKVRELGIEMLSRTPSWPGLAVYVDTKPENIGLVSDFSRFLRPDILVECKEQINWYKYEGFSRIYRHYDFLKPRLGSFIVSRHPVPEQARQELEGLSQTPPETQEGPEVAVEGQAEKVSRNIRLLDVGFDRQNLVPIMEALVEVKGTVDQGKGA